MSQIDASANPRIPTLTPDGSSATQNLVSWEERAEQTARRIYAAMGLPPPQFLLWFDSPIIAALSAYILSRYGEGPNRTPWNGLASVVRHEIIDKLFKCFCLDIWHHPNRSNRFLCGEQCAQTWESVRRAFTSSTSAVTGMSPGRFLDDDAESTWEEILGGPTSYFFFHKLLFPLDQLAIAQPWNLGSRHSLNWVLNGANSWLFEKVCVIARGPVWFRTDATGLAHDLDAPAIEYRDGWSLWYWRGRIVPWRLANGDIPNARFRLEHEPSLQRALLERLDDPAYFKKAGPQTIAKDRFGELFEFFHNGARAHFRIVRVPDAARDKTTQANVCLLSVPPTVKTPREAVAWTFGLCAEEYNPAIET